MTEKTLFAQRLQQTRTMRDLKQGELAIKAGLSISMVSLFEKGTRKPSFDSLRRLADELKVSIDYLMGRTDDDRFSETTTLTVNANLTDDDLEAARDFMARLAKKTRN